MNNLNIDLENCYGIKKLQAQFDFSQNNVYAIYAPNGAMKTSLAKTFKDLTDDIPSRDQMYPARVCKRKITDENGVNFPKESILVISPYDESFRPTEKTSTLLVDSKLRQEYADIHIEIDKSKEIFIEALKEQSGSKKNLVHEISSTFTKSNDDFYKALIRVKDEVLSQEDAPFADIQYDTIFDEKVLSFLGTKDFKIAIESYIKKYNELLAASIYFKKGTFDYYNASNIAKSLDKNGFFEAKHTVNLNADENLEIASQEQLEKLIAEEKEGISNDKELLMKFADIEKLITKNANTRDFKAYLEEHEELLPKPVNIESFKEEIWKSYFKVRIELYKDLIRKYLAAEKRKKEIEEEAGKQRTQWELVIDEFNRRFFVPFELTAKNKVSVVLGQAPLLSLRFTFIEEEGVNPVSVEEPELMKVLSTGEKKALYILNIIFDVETRKKAKQETVFIFDDIADSFDYKNKYAIIQYLQDIDREPYFRQIIMTHNFDFFRTIHSRFVKYDCCRFAFRNSNGISLNQACGIKNVFVKDWKLNFFTDSKKKIASIPFIRNLIEYIKGNQDPDFITLTSLLHWKSNSDSITQNDLDNIFKMLFGGSENSADGNRPIIDIIHAAADECLEDDLGINFENKIVLSIAIRITAEQFMVRKINDINFVESINSYQTPKLLAKYKELFSGDTTQIETIQRVSLMTPENIHLNSFMYEPILDMSDEHLRKLYVDIKALN
jgi:hypothetical protein